MPNSDIVTELHSTFSVEVASVEDTRPPKVLICIHGIRDNAAWCNESATVKGFVDNKIEIICVSYKLIDVFGFIFQFNTRNIEDDVLSQIDFIRTSFPDSAMSMLCHSNGTKVLANVIGRINFKLERIFLTGSVCLLKDVDRLKIGIENQGRGRRLVNDAAARDWWPIWAEIFRPDIFQATGVCGFHRFPVVERLFPYGHGGGVKKGHIERYILPVLVTGEVEKTDLTYQHYKKHAARYIRRTIFAISAILLFIFNVILLRMISGK